jgi:hypothetical protein
LSRSGQSKSDIAKKILNLLEPKQDKSSILLPSDLEIFHKGTLAKELPDANEIEDLKKDLEKDLENGKTAKAVEILQKIGHFYALDIAEEIRLLGEIKDVQDELSIMAMVFEDQTRVLRRLERLIHAMTSLSAQTKTSNPKEADSRDSAPKIPAPIRTRSSGTSVSSSATTGPNIRPASEPQQVKSHMSVPVRVSGSNDQDEDQEMTNYAQAGEFIDAAVDDSDISGNQCIDEVENLINNTPKPAERPDDKGGDDEDSDNQEDGNGEEGDNRGTESPTMSPYNQGAAHVDRVVDEAVSQRSSRKAEADNSSVSSKRSSHPVQSHSRKGVANSKASEQSSSSSEDDTSTDSFEDLTDDEEQGDVPSRSDSHVSKKLHVGINNGTINVSKSIITTHSYGEEEHTESQVWGSSRNARYTSLPLRTLQLSVDDITRMTQRATKAYQAVSSYDKTYVEFVKSANSTAA